MADKEKETKKEVKTTRLPEEKVEKDKLKGLSKIEKSFKGVKDKESLTLNDLRKGVKTKGKKVIKEVEVKEVKGLEKTTKVDLKITCVIDASSAVKAVTNALIPALKSVSVSTYAPRTAEVFVSTEEGVKSSFVFDNEIEVLNSASAMFKNLAPIFVTMKTILGKRDYLMPSKNKYKALVDQMVELSSAIAMGERDLTTFKEAIQTLSKVVEKEPIIPKFKTPELSQAYDQFRKMFASGGQDIAEELLKVLEKKQVMTSRERAQASTKELTNIIEQGASSIWGIFALHKTIGHLAKDTEKISTIVKILEVFERAAIFTYIPKKIYPLLQKMFGLLGRAVSPILKSSFMKNVFGFVLSPVTLAFTSLKRVTEKGFKSVVEVLKASAKHIQKLPGVEHFTGFFSRKGLFFRNLGKYLNYLPGRRFFGRIFGEEGSFVRRTGGFLKELGVMILGGTKGFFSEIVNYLTRIPIIGDLIGLSGRYLSKIFWVLTPLLDLFATFKQDMGHIGKALFHFAFGREGQTTQGRVFGRGLSWGLTGSLIGTLVGAFFGSPQLGKWIGGLLGTALGALMGYIGPERMKKFINFIISPFKKIAHILAPVAHAIIHPIDTLKKAFETYKAFVVNFVDSITHPFETAKKIFNWFADKFRKVVEVFKKVKDSIADFMDKVSVYIKTKLANIPIIGKWIKEKQKEIDTGVKSLLKAHGVLKEPIKETKPKTREETKPEPESYILFDTTSADKVSNSIKAGIEEVNKKHIDALTKVNTATVSDIHEGVKAGIEKSNKVLADKYRWEMDPFLEKVLTNADHLKGPMDWMKISEVKTKGKVREYTVSVGKDKYKYSEALVEEAGSKPAKFMTKRQVKQDIWEGSFYYTPPELLYEMDKTKDVNQGLLDIIKNEAAAKKAITPEIRQEVPQTPPQPVAARDGISGQETSSDRIPVLIDDLGIILMGSGFM